ncbi:MAG TPA: hypothetical protein GXX37_15065 [Clostridiaceae bacterium]|nr:hypothetical protein [Clostridiaceae bacterium]
MPINEIKLNNALKFIEQGIKNEYFPGAAVAIGNKSEVLRKEYFGNRCIYPKIMPMEEDCFTIWYYHQLNIAFSF